jgi:hypothetical protein
VKSILSDFLRISSYIGYTEGIDAKKLTQTIRRVYKTPSELEIDSLLDFALILAISNANFDGFDAKSKAYVEQTLDTIESYFRGVARISHSATNEDGETINVTLNCFPSFESENKTFNKVMIHKKARDKRINLDSPGPEHTGSYLHWTTPSQFAE